jgi:hypothetical protein
MANPYSDDDLTRRLASPGWRLVQDGADNPSASGTLEDMAKASHDQKTRGEAPGLIQEVETTVELDLIQIEKLWRYLGLPV